MREKSVTLAGRTIIVRESTVGDLRRKVLPAIIDTFGSLNLNAPLSEVLNETDKLFNLIVKLIPDVTLEMLDQAYMSELESLIQSWIEVNFSGLRNLFKQLFNLPTPRPS